MFPTHLNTIHAALGRPATYTPVAGSPVTLRAIRRGGGQPVSFGTVSVVLERVRFEVLRTALPDPVPGATLSVDGAAWIVQAVQPVENDAYGLKWSLDVAWGAAVLWRCVTGTGASQNPPSVTGAVTIAAPAAAGAGAASLHATYAVGRLLPGDSITIAGQVHTVTAPAAASANGFAAVGIAPALGADVAAGQGVDLSFAAEHEITAAISGYQARELQGGVQAGDLRIVLLPGAVTALPAAPKIGDMVTIGGIALRATVVNPVYSGAGIIAWEVTGRR